MGLFPYLINNCYSKSVSLSQQEVMAALKSKVEYRFWSKFWKDFTWEAYVSATIYERHFQLHYKPWYRNSFSPVFYGKIIPTEQGSIITGFFSLDWSVWVTLPIFIGVSIALKKAFFLIVVSGLFLAAHLFWEKDGVLAIKNVLEELKAD